MFVTVYGSSRAFSARSGLILKSGSRQMAKEDFVRLQRPENYWSHLYHHGNCATIHHARVEHLNESNERSQLCYKLMFQKLHDGLSIPDHCSEHNPLCNLRLAASSFEDAYWHFEVSRPTFLREPCQMTFILPDIGHAQPTMQI